MRRKKVDVTTLNNDWYSHGASFSKRVLWHYTSIIFIMNPFLPFYSLKSFVLRLFGAKVGKRCKMKPRVNIKHPWHLEIGDDVSIGEGVWIDNYVHVKLGNHSTISQGAMILTGNHDYKKTSFDLIVKSVVLEEGAWVGAKAVVCPGVICGSHSVLTVGSIATKNLEPYKIYQGNPAKYIKDRIIS